MKLVLDEPGSDDARDLLSDTTAIHSSRLLAPESWSAVARTTAAGPFTPAGAARAFHLLERLLDAVSPVDLEEEIAERASELARSLCLRGADAVHLASYEWIEAGDALFVTADGALAHAAETLGYAIAVPGAR